MFAHGACVFSSASPVKQILPEGSYCVLFFFVFTAGPGRTETWLELDRGDGCTALWMYEMPLNYKVHPYCRQMETAWFSQSARDWLLSGWSIEPISPLLCFSSPYPTLPWAVQWAPTHSVQPALHRWARPHSGLLPCYTICLRRSLLPL